MSQYYLTASTLLGYLLKQCISSSNRPNPMQVSLLLYSALLRAHLESFAQFWAPQYERDRSVLERVKWGTTKTLKGLEHLSAKDEAAGLDKRANLTKYLGGGCEGDRDRLFSVLLSGRHKSSGHKLKHKKLHLNITKHCEGDQALELVAYRDCGVSLLGNTHKMTGNGPGQLVSNYPAWPGRWDQIPSRGPFLPQPFCGRMMFVDSVCLLQHSFSRMLHECTW